MYIYICVYIYICIYINIYIYIYIYICTYVYMYTFILMCACVCVRILQHKTKFSQFFFSKPPYEPHFAISCLLNLFPQSYLNNGYVISRATYTHAHRRVRNLARKIHRPCALWVSLQFGRARTHICVYPTPRSRRAN